MSRRTVLLGVVLLVAVLTAGGVVWSRTGSTDSAPTFTAAAWLPDDDDETMASLTAALDSGVSEISPVWGELTADGDLDLSSVPAQVRLPLNRDGVRLVPTVQNYVGDGWAGDLVATVLGDPARRSTFVQQLDDAAAENNWNGVDIDFESLPETSGPQLTTFLTELADALHAAGRTLSIDVPARTTDAESGTLAFSYQAVGAIVDEFRVMAYDYSWSGGDPGSVAPLDWVRQVVDYTVAQVPADKVRLGMATYGYDWSGDTGKPLGAADAVKLAAKVGVTPTWDEATSSHTFSYEKKGKEHTVWYEDARSLAVKQQVAKDAGLRGIALWRLGGEDPQTWTTVAGATSTDGQR